MKSIREQIEDAVITAIKTALDQVTNPAAGYLGLVGEYNGELEDREHGVEDLIRRINGQFPAVLVEAGGGPVIAENAARRNFTRVVSLDLYVCSNNLRSRESRTRNDAAFAAATSRDPGIYQIVEHLHDLIAGDDFSLVGVGPSEPQSETSVVKATEICVWQLSFEFKTDANVEPWDNGNGQVLTSYFLKSQDSDLPLDVPPNPIVEAEGNIP